MLWCAIQICFRGLALILPAAPGIGLQETAACPHLCPLPSRSPPVMKGQCRDTKALPTYLTGDHSEGLSSSRASEVLPRLLFQRHHGSTFPSAQSTFLLSAVMLRVFPKNLLQQISTLTSVSHANELR